MKLETERLKTENSKSHPAGIVAKTIAPALHRALQEQDLVPVPMGMATGLASGLGPWQESLP